MNPAIVFVMVVIVVVVAMLVLMCMLNPIEMFVHMQVALIPVVFDAHNALFAIKIVVPLQERR